jgi:hypothetical protein
LSRISAVPKIAILEEAARTLDIPGGVRMIQEYYRQMRKFGCNIMAVVQQYDIIKDSPVRWSDDRELKDVSHRWIPSMPGVGQTDPARFIQRLL